MPKYKGSSGPGPGAEPGRHSEPGKAPDPEKEKAPETEAGNSPTEKAGFFRISVTDYYDLLMEQQEQM